MSADASPVTKPSRVSGVAAIFGTELTVIFDSDALRCQPSSVVADCVTSAIGSGSARANPPLAASRLMAATTDGKSLRTIQPSSSRRRC